MPAQSNHINLRLTADFWDDEKKFRRAIVLIKMVSGFVMMNITF